MPTGADVASDYSHAGATAFEVIAAIAVAVGVRADTWTIPVPNRIRVAQDLHRCDGAHRLAGSHPPERNADDADAVP